MSAFSKVPERALRIAAMLAAADSDTALCITSGSVLTIDLNGHTIDRRAEENGTADSAVITVLPNAVLTVKDSSPGASGRITGGCSPDGGGIINVGTLIVEGGCITGNRSTDKGGGIGNYSLLVMSGGTVTANSADKRGGGIYNGVKGRMTLVKDAVLGNSAPTDLEIHNLGAEETVGGETVFYTALTSYMDTLAVLPLIVLLIVLCFSVFIDNYLKSAQKRVMFIIIAAVLVLVLQDYFEYRVPADRIILRTLLGILGYSVRPVILALFLHLICPGRPFRAVWTAVGVNALIYLTALFSPLTFYFSGGHFHAGPLNSVCLVLSALLFFYCLFQTFRAFRPKKKKETWIPVFSLVMISLAVVMDYTVVYHYQPISFLTVAIVISCMMFYIWLHLQYVREHERALQAEHRIQIMMTQIQPHFLFNTLTAIRALCIKDSDAAARTIGLFAAYLRQNMESLDSSELIPLEKELEHTRIYAEIEMIRFPNISIEYDIVGEFSCLTKPNVVTQTIF